MRPMPAHDFICDKQNAARAANLGDARNVAVWRHDRTESCSNNWFENKSGGGVCVTIDKK